MMLGVLRKESTHNSIWKTRTPPEPSSSENVSFVFGVSPNHHTFS